MPSLLPPVEALTESSDDAEPLQPPVKRRKLTAEGCEVGQHVSALANQLCDCSKNRKKAKQSCFQKLKPHFEALEGIRQYFLEMHKIDQDQFATCRTTDSFWFDTMTIGSDLKPRLQSVQVFERIKYQETENASGSDLAPRRKHFLKGVQICVGAWRRIYGIGAPPQFRNCSPFKVVLLHPRSLSARCP